MKRFYFRFLIIFFVFFGGMNLSLASIKIGCIDMQKAIQMTSLGKIAKKTLEDEFQKKQKEINKAQEGLKAKEERLSKSSHVLDKSVLEKKRKELQEGIQSFQAMVQSNTLQIQKKERELLNPIVERLGVIINKLAEDEKYTIILERSRQGVLWMSSAIDLTQRVAEIFEESEKKKAAKTKKK